MSTYNPNYESAAYQCGAMMALYNAIQREANPTMNATVIQRFYASAIQTPGLVIGRLSQMSIHHLEEIRKKNKRLAACFEKELADTSARISVPLPTTLNLEKQAEFAVGYYQMCAEINHKKPDWFSGKKNAAQSANEE